MGVGGTRRFGFSQGKDGSVGIEKMEELSWMRRVRKSGIKKGWQKVGSLWKDKGS